MPHLKTLLLNNNRLESIPEDLAQLKSLNVLKLAYNNLSALPPGLALIPSLEKLDVWGGNAFPEDIKRVMKKNELIGFLRGELSLNTPDVIYTYPRIHQQSADGRETSGSPPYSTRCWLAQSFS